MKVCSVVVSPCPGSLLCCEPKLQLDLKAKNAKKEEQSKDCHFMDHDKGQSMTPRLPVPGVLIQAGIS